MTDQLDQAQHLEQWQRDVAIQQARAKPSAPTQIREDDAVICARCNQPISAARLATLPDVSLCVVCQTLLEQPCR